MSTTASPAARPTAVVFVLLALAAALLPALLAWMHAFGWPDVHRDAELFLAVAVNQAQGLGPKIDLFVEIYNASACHRGDWYPAHGQLYPWLLARLAPEPTVAGLHQALWYLNVAAYLGGMALVYVRLRDTPGCERTGALGLALAGGGAATVIALMLQGRPEHPLPALLTWSAVLGRWARAEPRLELGRRATELALVAASAPVGGVLLASLRVLERVLDPRPRPVADLLGLAAAAFAIWFALTSLIAPLPALEVFAHTLTCGAQSLAVGTRDHAALPWFWLFDLRHPLLALSFLLAALVLLEAAARPLALPRRLLAAGLLLSLAVLIYLLGLRRITTWYNLVGLLPVAAVLVWEGTDGATRASLWLRRTLALSLVALALGLVEPLATWQWLRSQGADLHEARARYAIFRAELAPAQRVLYDATSTPAILLDEFPFRLIKFDPDPERIAAFEQRLGVRIEHYLLRQYRPGVPPPQVGDFVLIAHDWSERPPPWWAKTYPGYRFAWYRRRSPDP